MPFRLPPTPPPDPPPDCRFCRVAGGEGIIAENPSAFAIEDRYPVTEGHLLVIPRRHFPDFFEMGRQELEAVFELVWHLKRRLAEADPRIQGFNLGVNSGRAAGQTVFHCHLHLIPRREGDVEDPRGGVRGVIPEKRIYPPGA